MDLLFVAKHRKVQFDVVCTIYELAGVPYVSGSYYIKWRLKQGGTARGFTTRASVKDHVVKWDVPLNLDATLVAGKDGVLQPCELQLKIRQARPGEASDDMGHVTINLADFASISSSRAETHRYLLQESHINAVLRVGVIMNLVKGDASFRAPPAVRQDQLLDSIRDVTGPDDGVQDEAEAQRNKEIMQFFDKTALLDKYRITEADAHLHVVDQIFED
ncbi:hypothetical protein CAUPRSCDRAFT_12601, partial [Caulochytrium protostelioides]